MNSSLVFSLVFARLLLCGRELFLLTNSTSGSEAPIDCRRRLVVVTTKQIEGKTNKPASIVLLPRPLLMLMLLMLMLMLLV